MGAEEPRPVAPLSAPVVYRSFRPTRDVAVSTPHDLGQRFELRDASGETVGLFGPASVLRELVAERDALRGEVAALREQVAALRGQAAQAAGERAGLEA